MEFHELARKVRRDEWKSMEILGKQWSSRDIAENSWNTIKKKENQKKKEKKTTDFYQFPWAPLEFHECP